MIEPETVVVKLVVASQSRKRSHPNAVGEEDLSGTIDPGLAVQQLGPVHVHVVPEAVEGSWKSSLVSKEKFAGKIPGKVRARPSRMNMTK